MVWIRADAGLQTDNGVVDISRRMEQIGGKAEVQSTPGTETKVSLFLPPSLVTKIKPAIAHEATIIKYARSLDRTPKQSNVAVVMEPQFITVQIEKPEPVNFILGQTHFIKSVEDIHEALVNAVPGIKFGLAFCEASGKCLVRCTGTDPAMIELAKKNALAIGAGHSFILFLGEGFYPVNVLNAVKMVPEVCQIFCATANPTQVLVATTRQGRGIVGVVDGVPPQGVEGAADIEWRKRLLRQIGYKL
jgi:adenosine/AMP kinase